MKRLRDSAAEAAAGPVDAEGARARGAAAVVGGVVQFDDEDQHGAHRKKLSRREMKEARVSANKKWRLVDRKVGSGVDPNPRHTLYYQAQIPELAASWDAFQQSLNDPLCVTFRAGASCPPAVKAGLARTLSLVGGKASLSAVLYGVGCFEFNGVVFDRDSVVREISWTPFLTWQLCCDSSTLSREPALNALSKFLQREVSLGHVCRQELASMLPVLFLDVQSHDKVLDICAAPGSKTEQLLSKLRADCGGLLVANDGDAKRIKTLSARFRRCGASNLVITCSRAEDLSAKLQRCNFQFDRIVADVPCSGDGTIRKFPHVWRLFRPRIALELHSIQLQIAIAAVNMLKSGGRFVYSTCSLNPLEDEAVVGGLLAHFAGRLALVKSSLPGLRSRPGLSTWQVTPEVFTLGEDETGPLDRCNDDSSSYTWTKVAFPTSFQRKKSLAKLPELVPTMFPPQDPEAHLEYCHRILPHDQDMGGFFVAVFELSVSAAEATAVSGPGVSKDKSVKTMRALGYNPKVHQETSGPSGGGYSLLDQNISQLFSAKSSSFYLFGSDETRMGETVDNNGDDDYDEKGNADNDDNQDGIEDDDTEKSLFGSRENGWKKIAKSKDLPSVNASDRRQFLSIVSPAAKSFMETLGKSKRVNIEQVGVEVGSFGVVSGGKPKVWLNGDNASILSQHLNLPHVLVSPEVFKRLCLVGSEQRDKRVLSQDLHGEVVAAGGDALSHCPSCLVRIAPGADYQVSASENESAGGGKRRLSKAEKKRLKSSGSEPSTPHHHVMPANQQASSSVEGLVLLVQRLEAGGIFHVQSATDVCQSYADALR